MRLFLRIFLQVAGALAVLAGVMGIAAAQGNIDVGGMSNRTLYEAGQTVRVSGVVNGDVICAAQTVTIDAQVNGDILCAGQSITVNGPVSGSVRLAGQSVNVNGKIGKSLSVAAQSFSLAAGGGVSGDAGIVAQSASWDGPVGRDLTGAVGHLTISSNVGRNVTARVNNLTLASGAVVKGSVNYTSHNRLARAQNVTVGGAITQRQPKADHNRGKSFGGWLAASFIGLVLALVFSLVLVLLLPQVFRRWTHLALQRPWRALLTGFLASIIGPFLFLALLITVIGIPLAILYLLASIVVAMLSLPFAAFFIGERLFGESRTVALAMLIGVLVLWLLNLIPIVGVIVVVLAYWLGLGTIIMNLWRLYPRPYYGQVKHVAIKDRV